MCQPSLWERVSGLPSAKEGGAGWQVDDVFRTDPDILVRLCQHQQTFMQCHLSGSMVIHSLCLVGRQA